VRPTSQTATPRFYSPFDTTPALDVQGLTPAVVPYHRPPTLFEQFGRTFSKPFFSSPFRISLIGKHIDMPIMQDAILHVMESMVVFFFQLWKARSYSERVVACVAYAKMTHIQLEDFYGYVAAVLLYPLPSSGLAVQGDDDVWEDTFDDMQEMLDKYDVVKKSPFFTKMYKVGMYGLAANIFKPLGIDFDSCKFSALEKEHALVNFKPGFDMFHCICDTALFLTRRGYQCVKTGSLMPIFHSESHYQRWFDTATDLIRNAQFMSNPDCLKINRFTWLSNLRAAIEKGHCLKKYVQNRDTKLMVTRLLASLEMAHDNEVTKRAATEGRRLPLVLLAFGGSSIGKTSFEELLFHHYAKIRGLDPGPHNIYTRVFTDDFYSGFNTSMWGIRLDDIAFMSPKLGVMDPSMAEMLSIINNVAFTPPQAELSDKGRTPLKCEICVGSTNTEDLNAVAYFSCPFAVQRRFPWVLDLVVRPEFQDPSRPGMLCPKRAGVPQPDSYPDFWQITVKRIVPANESRRDQRGKTEIVHVFQTLAPFLQWYNRLIVEHNEVQDRVMRGNTLMVEAKLCEGCKVPLRLCTCEVYGPEPAPFNHMDDDPVRDASAAEYNTERCLYCRNFFPDNCVCLDVQSSQPEHDYDLFGELAQQAINGRDAVPTYYNVSELPQSFFSATAMMNERESSLSFNTIFIWMYIHHAYFLNLIACLIWGRCWFEEWICKSRHKRAIFRLAIGAAGETAQQSFGNVDKLAKIGVGITAAVAGLAMCFKFYSTFKCEVQGVTSSKAPASDENPRNSPNYEPAAPFSVCDLSQTTLASRGQDPAIFEANVRKGVVKFDMCKNPGGQRTSAINVRGSVYMVNTHAVPPKTPFILQIVSEMQGAITTNQKEIMITSDMIYNVPDCDLTFIHLRCRPPGTDLTAYFPNPDFMGLLDGKYIGRLADGQPWSRPIVNLRRELTTWPVHDRFVSGPVWEGRTSTPTMGGDCGTPLVVT